MTTPGTTSRLGHSGRFVKPNLGAGTPGFTRGTVVGRRKVRSRSSSRKTLPTTAAVLRPAYRAHGRFTGTIQPTCFGSHLRRLNLARTYRESPPVRVATRPRRPTTVRHGCRDPDGGSHKSPETDLDGHTGPLSRCDTDGGSPDSDRGWPESIENRRGETLP